MRWFSSLKPHFLLSQTFLVIIENDLTHARKPTLASRKTVNVMNYKAQSVTGQSIISFSPDPRRVRKSLNLKNNSGNRSPPTGPYSKYRTVANSLEKRNTMSVVRLHVVQPPAKKRKSRPRIPSKKALENLEEEISESSIKLPKRKTSITRKNFRSKTSVSTVDFRGFRPSIEMAKEKKATIEEEDDMSSFKSSVAEKENLLIDVSYFLIHFSDVVNEKVGRLTERVCNLSRIVEAGPEDQDRKGKR